MHASRNNRTYKKSRRSCEYMTGCRRIERGENRKGKRKKRVCVSMMKVNSSSRDRCIRSRLIYIYLFVAIIYIRTVFFFFYHFARSIIPLHCTYPQYIFPIFYTVHAHAPHSIRAALKQVHVSRMNKFVN